MSVGSNPTIPNIFIKMTSTTSLFKFKKNSKLLKVSKLYFDLVKTKHLLTFFLGGFKQKHYKHLFRLIKTPQLFLSFLIKIESRLEFILVKSGLVLTGLQAKQLILHKCISINKSKIPSTNFELKVGDLIILNNTFMALYKPLLILNLFKTFNYFKFLKRKKLIKKIQPSFFFSYLKFPLFLEINFKTATIYFSRLPIFNEFFFSKTLSLYDINQFYFIL